MAIMLINFEDAEKFVVGWRPMFVGTWWDVVRPDDTITGVGISRGTWYQIGMSKADTRQINYEIKRLPAAFQLGDRVIHAASDCINTLWVLKEYRRIG